MSFEFTYCNSGHNPAILFRRQTSTIEWLNPTGPAVGIIENYKVNSAAVHLLPGDMLMLYSDGAPDTTNSAGEEFSRQRLAEIILQNCDRQPRELVELVKRALHEFSAGRPVGDDTTLVIGKVQGQLH
jgi:sigma-B regulation protein RsbU (phosphoserine phosphatase)